MSPGMTSDVTGAEISSYRTSKNYFVKEAYLNMKDNNILCNGSLDTRWMANVCSVLANRLWSWSSIEPALIRYIMFNGVFWISHKTVLNDHNIWSIVMF